MEDFEQFWISNQKRYLEMARREYDRLAQGAWIAYVSIDSDDDFSLDIEHNFTIFAVTKKELREKLSSKLQNAGLTYVKEWSVTKNGETTSGVYTHTWTGIRDAALRFLKKGKETYFTYGGNQTIQISIAKNT